MAYPTLKPNIPRDIAVGMAANIILKRLSKTFFESTAYFICFSAFIVEKHNSDRVAAGNAKAINWITIAVSGLLNRLVASCSANMNSSVPITRDRAKDILKEVIIVPLTFSGSFFP